MRVRIERFLKPSGAKPFFVVGDPDHRTFPTLKKLKEFYGAKLLVRDGVGWAINGKGRRIEWTEYAASIGGRGAK